MSTQAIARHLAAARYEDLPFEAVEATKKSILDTLGVMLPPSSLVKNCISIYELMSEGGGKPESTIIGFGGKAPCWVAAYINGSLAHALDFDNCVGLEKPLMHPTGSSFPAALAMVGRAGKVSGKEFITAVALGDDLCTRLAACPRGNVVSDYPFFPVTTFGVFSAAAAAGKLLNLSEPEIVNALGLALNRVSGTVKGLFSSELRAVRDGLNAREGVICALLAGQGMDSCKDSIEILFDVYYRNDVDTSYLTADLGKHFRGSEVGFKPWPSCQGTHSYLQAVLQIVTENRIPPEQVEQVILHGNKEGYSLCTPEAIKQSPTTSITAKIALPFVIGLAIVYKNVSISHFLPENLSDSAVIKIAKKVVFKLDASLGSFASIAEIITADGKVFKCQVDKLRGSIQNPLSTQELITKFKDCARYAKKPLSIYNVDQLIDKILDLENIKDINEITDILV
jgi:2-methylcitrate dehydratase PrpD